MNQYRFIAIDIDGTLLDDQDHFDIARLNKDIIKLQQRGIHFIIASGNSYDALSTIFAPCPQVTTFVAENGGRIIINGRSIFSKAHSRATLQQLLATVNNDYPTPDILSLSGKTKTMILDRYRQVPVPYYPHHDYFSDLQEIDEPIYNLNLSWFAQRLSPALIQTYVDKLNHQFKSIQATYSGAFGIDILPAGVNKAAGLKTLVEDYLMGDLKQLVAFGDTSNDIEMLQAAGLGYAMKNATDDLLAVADAVTSWDNNHNGLLAEIERLFL